MSDEISQKMTLDASSVIQQLGAVDSAYKNLSTTLGTVGSSFSSFNTGSAGVEKVLRGIASSANSAASALAKLSTVKAPSVSGGGVSVPPAAASGAAALNAQLASVTSGFRAAQTASTAMGNGASNALASATRSTAGFAVSLETVTRVISTQLIVRALSQIRSAVEDSFQGFIKFNQAAAEIQTILDQPLKTIRDDVRQLSDAFNSPLLDVAEAKYQAISNGFVTAADSSKVLTAALKFGKVGIASVTDSVDLISTSLNAYGNSADHAETISAKLFKTVELGRVVGTELANSFGRVAPVAKEIGASEDEILAAFSSITIGGVKASEAATQIRATLTALLKPSDAATDAFRKLGVASGEELIQAKGFHGALQALIGATDGSASAIAALFPNVRALGGVLRETGTGASVFQDHLAQIQKSGASLLNQKYNLRIDSNAEKVASEVNKLKNAVLTGAGEALTDAAGKALSFAGGADAIATAGAHLLPILAATAIGLTVYGAAAAVVSARNSVLAASATATAAKFRLLGGAIQAATILYAAYEAGAAIGNAINDRLDEPRKAAEAAGKAFIADQQTAAAAAAQIAQQAEDKKFQAANNTAAKIRAVYNGQLDAARDLNQQLIASDQDAMNRIVEQHQQAADRQRQIAQQAQQDINQSKKDAGSLADRLSDQQFNYANSRFSDSAKARRDEQRAISLSQQGAKAATHGDKAASDSAFNRAEGFAQQAISSAQTTRNIGAQAQAEKTLEAVLTARIKAEQSYQTLRKNDAAVATKNGQAEIEKTEKLKTLQADFLKHANAFNDDGSPLSGKQLGENLSRARADLQKFSKLGGATVPALLATPAALDKLRDQIQGSLKQREFAIRLVADTSKLGKDANLNEILREGTQQRKNEHQATTDKIGSNQKAANANAEILAARTRAQLSFKEKPGTAERIAHGIQYAISPQPATKIASDSAAIQSARQEVQALIGGHPSAQQVNGLTDRAQQLQGTATTSLQSAVSHLAAEVNELANVFRSQNQQPAAAANSPQPATIEEPEAAAHAMGGRIGYFANGGLLGNQMPGPGYFATGGYADGSALGMNTYLAKGGYPFSAGGYEAVGLAAGGIFKPRGSDTVPAMLTPGEFIVSAPNAKKFYSQLKSINAGVQPGYKAGGGGVHYHDYQVNNTIHAPDAKASAREMMNTIRREQRKGSSK